MNYAYLRVSTDKQDVDNQRHGILEYSNKHKINDLIFIEDTVTSKKKWKERKIGELLTETMVEGDTLVVAEISRMARSTLQVLGMLELAADSKFSVHIAKQNLIFTEKGDMTSTIMATVLGMVAQIEREFISLRTAESLASRAELLKTQGYFLNSRGERVTSMGRPKGRAKHVKLDDHEREIIALVEKGISKRGIAKIMNCAPSTLYDWLTRNKLKISKVRVAQ